MLIVLFVLSSAFSQEVSCNELLKMHQVGMPTENILEFIQEADIPPEVPACLEANAAPAALIQAATKAVKRTQMTLKNTPPPPLEPEPAAPITHPAKKPGATKATAHRPLPFEDRKQILVRATLEQYYELPSQGVAAAFSIFPGFGAGHYYAGSIGSGTAFLLTDLSLWSTMVGATLARDMEPKTKTALLLTSSIGLFLSKLLATLTAPGAARRAAFGRFR